MKKIVAILAVIALIAALTVPAFAVEFTPSAETKAAPEVVQQTDESGNAVEVIVYNEDGTVAEDTGEYSVVITSASNPSAAPSAEIAEQLADAKEQVQAADTVAELTSGMSVALQMAKASSTDAADKEVDMTDLVVRDLFDVTVMKGGEVAEDVGATTFTVSTNLKQDEMYFVLHNYEEDEWEVVEDTSLAANGDLTITLNSRSPIAIITPGTVTAAAGDGAPTSPQTGENASLLLILGLVFAAAAVVMFTVGRKSSSRA